jgi:hypothetical protein
MPSQPHPAVLAVQEAAAAVFDHDPQPATGSFWRRWFDNPGERHMADIVRNYVLTLDLLLDVPPTMLTRDDLTGVGEDADRVIRRIEAAIDEPGASEDGTAAALAQAVYVIRARYEELYQRGATKID